MNLLQNISLNGITERTEEMHGIYSLKIMELEKNFYNPYLSDENIVKIFNYIKKNYPDIVKEKQENIFEFDFHELSFPQIDTINKFFLDEDFEFKRYKKKNLNNFDNLL